MTNLASESGSQSFPRRLICRNIKSLDYKFAAMKLSQNHQRVRVVAALVFVLSFCVVSRADAQSVDKSVDEQGFSLEPFDVGLSTINPDFKGHNIVDLYKAVDKLFNLKKGEFETTENFIQRTRETINKANDSIDYGALKMGDYVAFPINSNRVSRKKVSYKSDIPASFVYDADFQTLKVSCSCYRHHLMSSFFLPLLQIGPRYVGFYFKRTLNMSVKEEFSVYAGAVDPAYAEKNLKNLRGIFVGQLFSYDNEQFQEEIKSMNYTTGIPLKNVQFWVYNIETGEVVVKYASFEFERGANRALGDTTLDAPGKYYRKIKKEQRRSPLETRQESTNQPEDAGSVKKEGMSESVAETWQEILAGRKRLAPQSWETKQPTLVVNSDAQNFANALADAPKGSIVQIARGARVKLGAPATLESAIALVGETGNPDDAVLVVDPEASLAIQSSHVFFKGITFEVESEANADQPASAIRVEPLGDALFIDCVFKGVRSSDAIGVQIDEGDAKFWHCAFRDFGNAGIVAQDDGTATAAYCEFSGNKVGANALSEGTIYASACFFSKNETGYGARNGGGGRLNSSLFENNETPWKKSAGNARAAEIDEKSIVVVK